MLPNQPMPPMPAGPMSGAAPEAGGGAEGIKRQLVMMLTQAKKIAEQNGISFEEVVSEVSGGGPAAPKPPKE